MLDHFPYFSIFSYIHHKKYFLLKLVAPRPTFPADMTETEALVMKEHGDYLKEFVDRGTVIVMGPVMDPTGPWGVAVVEAGSEDEVQFLISRDPTVLSGLGFRYEVYPMARAMVRK